MTEVARQKKKDWICPFSGSCYSVFGKVRISLPDAATRVSVIAFNEEISF